MDRQPTRFIAARGAAALIVAMGIGRFAFTPLLPPMQAEAQFSDAAAGLLASINLFGYFAGALAAGHMTHEKREAAYRIGLAIAVLADLLMAAPLGVPGWAVVRAAAGVSSGLIFILATAFVLEQRGHAALHFTGVGFGIVLSGIVAVLVPVWQTSWLMLAGLCLLLALFAAGLRGAALYRDQPRVRARLTWSWPLAWLTIAYSLQGLGYIISGTFLVAILHGLPETAGLGAWAWLVVGLGAIPSALIWARLALRLGSWRALAIAYAVQAAGMILPFAGGAPAAIVAAISFGGTFIGITGVSLTLAARLRPAQAGQAVARLTIFYSVGQAIGPLLAGLAAEAAKGFTLPLIFAAVVIAVAGILSLVGEASARSEFHSGHFGEADVFKDRRGEDAG
jgi:predicted MFS family arabinose efflux permease